VEVWRTCTKCGVKKPLSSFYKRGDGSEKLKSACAVCFCRQQEQYHATPGGRAAQVRYDASPGGRARNLRYNATPGGRAKQVRYNARYNATPGGRARNLRSEHGLDDAESEFWGRLLTDEDTRCAICGIPNYEIARLNKGGPWFPFLGRRTGGGASRRLQLGHVVAGQNEGGFVPLCSTCNRCLGVRTLDERNGVRVLKAVTNKWDRTYMNATSLWWMNTDVDERGHGVGGRLRRSPATERREKMFKVYARAGTPVKASATA
jgi:hypothetical protein